MPRKFTIETLRCPPRSFSDFILHDGPEITHQHLCLLQLRELSAFYERLGILPSCPADPHTFAPSNNVDWAFELFLMSRSIRKNRPHVFNYSVTPTPTRQACQVFILAIIKRHAPVVSYFLSNRVFGPNQSLFGTSSWPSYYLLAGSTSSDIAALFHPYRPRRSVSWNGLTSSILSTLAGMPGERYSYIDFITYRQYQLLNSFRGVELIDSVKPVPLFLLDFACMAGNTLLIKQTLDALPEAGGLSLLSFIVQNEEHILLILSRYGFRIDQSFNGLTPLHYSALSGNLCTLSILLYIGFPIVRNSEEAFPNEVGEHAVREKTSILLNVCASALRPESVEGPPARIFSRVLFRENMEMWMRMLKYNTVELDKYAGIFRYLDFNMRNRILRKSRFNIINVFTLSKSLSNVEQSVERLGVERPVLRSEYGNLEGEYARHFRLA